MRRARQHVARYVGAYWAGRNVRVALDGEQGLSTFVGKRIWLNLTPKEAEKMGLRLIQQAWEARSKAV